MSQSKYPSGWNEDRVRRVLEHYESQTDDEAVAEDEAVDLVQAVRELLAKKEHG